MVNTKEINGTENNINEIINKITKLIQCEDDNNKFMDGLKIIEEELKKSECKTIKDNKIITKVAIELVSMNIENYDIDNFGGCNMDIFNYEEAVFSKEKMYQALSLVCISLIDLGLIEVTS